MSRTKRLEERVERLEREFKKMMEELSLIPTVDPLSWKAFTDLDKKIIEYLLEKKYVGATTTEIAKKLELKKPESYGRTTIWRKLRRIEKISRRLKGAPIVIMDQKRWCMNYDEFSF